jgi:hypothetical protein
MRNVSVYVYSTYYVYAFLHVALFIYAFFFQLQVIEQFEYCLDHCLIVEHRFQDITAELNVIWKHSSDVLILATEKKNTALQHSVVFPSSSDEDTDEDSDLVSDVLRKAREFSKSQDDDLRFLISAQASPSLFELIGQRHLGKDSTTKKRDLSSFLDDQGEDEGEDVAVDAAADDDDDDCSRDEDDPSGLLTMLRIAWNNNRKNNGSWNSIFEFKIRHPSEGLKDCELVVNKKVLSDGTSLMVAVARDITSRSKEFMLGFEREKNLIARETAHTVKNLNTTAHHKLLELLEELHDMPDSASEEEMETKKTAIICRSSVRYRRREHFTEQLRQTLAIMMTAAQQTYQLSRVGEILRGEPQHLTESVEQCTKTWQKICASNFHADPDALALLVDEFRLVALLSNAWNNALAHGDCTRMNETEISLRARFPDMLEVKVVNPSQIDEKSFETIDEEENRDSFQHKKDGFGHSPAAKLTTQMGLSWMRKLCGGRLSLTSKGAGGPTTLTCLINADFSELTSNAIKEYNKKRRCSVDIDLIESKEVNPKKQCALTLFTAESKKQNRKQRQFTPRPAPKNRSPSFTSSPKSSLSCLPPYAASLLQEKMSNKTHRVWDAALSNALLQKYGVLVIDDSRAFALQMQKGLSKAFGITKCRTICGSQNSRYSDVCTLLHEDITAEPALVVLDRNLGHGCDKMGRRVSMPHGDIVSTRLRQKGYNCCLALLTGDSSEQLEKYSKHSFEYYYDCVLDKHHLPSYVHIFEQYTKFIAAKLPLGEILLSEMKLDKVVFLSQMSLEEVDHIKEEVSGSFEYESGFGKVRGLRMILDETLKELHLLSDSLQRYRGIVKLSSKINEDDNIHILEAALKRAQPLLKLCRVEQLCTLIGAVLKNTKGALSEAVRSSCSLHDGVEESELIQQPGLLLLLSRETSLMEPIFATAIGVLDDCSGGKGRPITASSGGG